MSGVFPRLKNPLGKLSRQRERNRGRDIRVYIPIILLPIVVLFIPVLLLTVLSSPFRGPFSFDKTSLSLGLQKKTLSRILLCVWIERTLENQPL